MARCASVVVPGRPHHVTQRGNRLLPMCFCDDDYRASLALMAEHRAACGVRSAVACSPAPGRPATRRRAYTAPEYPR